MHAYLALPRFTFQNSFIRSVTSDDDDNMSDISESGIDMEKVATPEEKEEAGRIKGDANKAFVCEYSFVAAFLFLFFSVQRGGV